MTTLQRCPMAVTPKARPKFEKSIPDRAWAELSETYSRAAK